MLKISKTAKLYNSRNAILLILFTAIYILFNQARWTKEKRVIEWDVISYYAYLPATFIYKDITLDFTENYKGEHKFTIWYDKTEDGNKFIRTSMGLSILYSPFFFMGHLAANILNYDTGGYSAPYKFFLQFSCIFYLALGLFFLRKSLLIYFKDKIVALVLLIITICTNLGYYSVIENTMSHAYNFSLISIFIYLTILWHKKSSIKRSLLLGLIFGLISLIRPTNFVVILFFLFFGVTSFKSFQNRILFFVKKWNLILIMIIAYFIPWLPQLLYWKTITGQWLFFSYSQAGASFFFGHPQIINGLFSYRKGWFLYTPAMIFSIIGIILLYKKNRDLFLPVLISFLIFIYVIFSWWSWWYGGGLSIRAMIDIYGILSFPLAAFLVWMFDLKNKYWKYALMFVFVFITLKSGFINFQYKYVAIHFDSNTKTTYWKGFFKHKTFPGYWESLCKPDYTLARKGIYVCNPVK